MKNNDHLQLALGHKSITNIMHFKCLIFILILGLISSCDEPMGYEVNIYLLNQTGIKIDVVLLPTEAYSGMIGYKFSSNGDGFRSNSFRIDSGTSAHLFTNAKLSESASQIARKAFKELAIILQDGSNTRIYFSPDTVINYNFNIFLNDDVWIFEKMKNARPTQFKNNPVESHNYYFVINNENIVIQE